MWGVKFDFMANVVIKLHIKMIAHKNSAFCMITKKFVETLKRSGYVHGLVSLLYANVKKGKTQGCGIPP